MIFAWDCLSEAVDRIKCRLCIPDAGFLVAVISCCCYFLLLLFLLFLQFYQEIPLAIAYGLHHPW